MAIVKSRASFLRQLVAVKGWQLGEFIRAMEQTGHVGKGVLSRSTVQNWYFEGPPKGGPNHRAMLAALGIAEGSDEQARLQGRQPWHSEGHPDLLGWLRQADPGIGGISLRLVGERGIRPIPEGDEELPGIPERGMVQIVLGLAAPCFALVLNHSRVDGTLWVLMPSGLAPDGHLIPEARAGIVCLPVPTPGVLRPAAAYPIGGPKGRNDLYAVLMRAPLPVALSFADTSERALVAQEINALGEALRAHEDAVTEVRRFAYLVE